MKQNSSILFIKKILGRKLPVFDQFLESKNLSYDDIIFFDPDTIWLSDSNNKIYQIKIKNIPNKSKVDNDIKEIIIKI
jgi:nicotinamide riboside kinase